MRALPRHLEGPARYAELHGLPMGSRFSRLWQPWPELYLDLPWRVTRGKPVPLLAAWADANQFPIRLCEVELSLASPRGVLQTRRQELDLRLVEVVGGQVLLELELDEPGLWQLWADVRVERLPGAHGVAGQSLRFRNQLAPGLPEEPLQVRVDAHPMPRLPGMVQGDPHVHSSATRDMIEFGPPPELLRHAATTLDLDWFALTDHSYDLDDDPLDWHRRHPELPVWEAQQAWIRHSATTNGPFVLPGEECSVGGVGGGLLHLLILAADRFWPGSADGGEGWRPRRAEWRLPALMEALRETGSLALSAHTGEHPGPGERLLLGRRAWRGPDMALVQGHQILSGGLGGAFRHGLALWGKELAQGRMSPIVAGGDSHGHFSLGRSIRVPGRSLSWGRHQLFGRYRSSVLLDEGESLAPTAQGPDRRGQRLVEEMAGARVMLGDGPLLHAVSGGGHPVLGGPLGGSRPWLHARLHQDAGALRWLRLWGMGSHGEELVKEWRQLSEDGLEAFPADWQRWRCLRAELRQADGFAMTNAWWPSP